MVDKKPQDVIEPVTPEPVPTAEPESITKTTKVKIPPAPHNGDKAYFVTLPDGSVVSSRGEFAFTQPGTYVIEGTEFTVE